MPEEGRAEALGDFHQPVLDLVIEAMEPQMQMRVIGGRFQFMEQIFNLLIAIFDMIELVAEIEVFEHGLKLANAMGQRAREALVEHQEVGNLFRVENAGFGALEGVIGFEGMEQQLPEFSVGDAVFAVIEPVGGPNLGNLDIEQAGWSGQRVRSIDTKLIEAPAGIAIIGAFR